jgi:hypothetical protein
VWKFIFKKSSRQNDGFFKPLVLHKHVTQEHSYQALHVNVLLSAKLFELQPRSQGVEQLLNCCKQLAAMLGTLPRNAKQRHLLCSEQKL